MAGVGGPSTTPFVPQGVPPSQSHAGALVGWWPACRFGVRPAPVGAHGPRHGRRPAHRGTAAAARPSSAKAIRPRQAPWVARSTFITTNTPPSTTKIAPRPPPASQSRSCDPHVPPVLLKLAVRFRVELKQGVQLDHRADGGRLGLLPLLLEHIAPEKVVRERHAALGLAARGRDRHTRPPSPEAGPAGRGRTPAASCRGRPR